jgi:hypothetical protein
MLPLAISPRFVINVTNLMIAVSWIPFLWSPYVLFALLGTE